MYASCRLFELYFFRNIPSGWYFLSRRVLHYSHFQRAHILKHMKQDGFSIQQFALNVVIAFQQKYPDEIEDVGIDEQMSEQDKMEKVLDYCVKKGYVLPELLAQFED